MATGTVTASALNVRPEGSTARPPVGTLALGTRVQVVGTRGDWLEIRAGSVAGFVFARYVALDPAGPPPSPAPAAAAERGVVTASTLNVRPGPSPAGAPLGTLPRGAGVEIVERRGGWYGVRAGDLRGFVSAEWVRLEGQAQGGAAVVSPPPVDAGGFLSARPALREQPLAPPADERVDPLPPSGRERTAADTWNRYGGLLRRVSAEIGIDPAAAVAVLCVESGGAGFAAGRMIIRFENHQFYDRWGKGNRDVFDEHFRFDPAKRWTGHLFRADASEPWTEFHGKQDAEWRVFEFARKLHEAAAMESISMGAPQIMGFNHAAVGHATVQSMFAAFAADARFQILGMFDFIRGRNGTSEMMKSLRAADYDRFAFRYNGSGQAAVYGARIRGFVEAARAAVPGL